MKRLLTTLFDAVKPTGQILMKSTGTFLLMLISISAWSQRDSLDAINNAGVQSKHIAYEGSKEKKQQETTLPNLELTAGFFLNPMVLPMGNQTSQFTAMQMFPWFGTYESIRREAEAMEDVAFQEYRTEQNRVLLQLSVTKLNLYNLKKRTEFEQERLSLLQAIEDFQVSRYSAAGKSANATGAMGMAGKSSAGQGMSQLLLTRMEIKTLQNEISTLQDNFDLEIVRHNLLLNTDRNATIELPDTLGLLAPPASSSFENNPMIQMVDAEKRAAEASEQMATKMGSPMIGAGVNYMVMKKPSGGDFPMADGKDMIMPMVSLSLPVYRKKFNAQKKEARLSQESLIRKREQVQNDLSLEYAEAQQMLKTAERNLLLAREQTDLAEKAAALMLSEYTSGMTSYDEVLRMKSNILMLKIDAVDAVVSYNTAVFKLIYLLNSY